MRGCFAIFSGLALFSVNATVLLVAPFAAEAVAQPKKKSDRGAVEIIDKEILAPAAKKLVPLARGLMPYVLEQANGFRQLLAKVAKAPESCSLPLTCTTKSSIEAKIRDGFGQSMTKLVPEELSLLLKKLADHEVTIRKEQNSLAVLRDRVLDAPDNVPWYDWLSTSKAGHKKNISEAAFNIAKLHLTLDTTAGQAASYVRERVGIELGQEEVSDLLGYAGGQDLLRAMIALAVAKEISADLERRIANAQSREVALQWYDAQAFLVATFTELFAQQLRMYDETWLPRLETIGRDAEARIAKLRGKIEGASIPENKAALREIVAANEKYLADVKRYLSVVRDQREGIKQARAVANETLETIDAARETLRSMIEFASIVKRSSSSYARLVSVNLPRFKPFENEGDRKIFRALTAEVSF